MSRGRRLVLVVGVLAKVFCGILSDCSTMGFLVLSFLVLGVYICVWLFEGCRYCTFEVMDRNAYAISGQRVNRLAFKVPPAADYISLVAFI